MTNPTPFTLGRGKYHIHRLSTGFLHVTRVTAAGEIEVRGRAAMRIIKKWRAIHAAA